MRAFFRRQQSSDPHLKMTRAKRRRFPHSWSFTDGLVSTGESVNVIALFPFHASDEWYTKREWKFVSLVDDTPHSSFPFLSICTTWRVELNATENAM